MVTFTLNKIFFYLHFWNRMSFFFSFTESQNRNSKDESHWTLSVFHMGKFQVLCQLAYSAFQIVRLFNSFLSLMSFKMHLKWHLCSSPEHRTVPQQGLLFAAQFPSRFMLRSGTLCILNDVCFLHFFICHFFFLGVPVRNPWVSLNKETEKLKDYATGEQWGKSVRDWEFGGKSQSIPNCST